MTTRKWSFHGSVLGIWTFVLMWGGIRRSWRNRSAAVSLRVVHAETEAPVAPNSRFTPSEATPIQTEPLPAMGLHRPVSVTPAGQSL